MEYYSILNLKKEPFSNSPDPEYFFQSKQHLGCLQKLELSIRLRRGLNVVIGDVGAGKTTLCRHLIRRFASEENMETHLILDPYFKNPMEFLATVAKMFRMKGLAPKDNEWSLKEKIKKTIFQKGVDEDKTVILIIDEGQKLPVFCLEILREFLNYETNEYKLLQIAIFAQKEFEATLDKHDNFADRINLYHQLEPMNFKDTKAMIRFRIVRASDAPGPPVLFTYPALKAIFGATGGYPRKIINLCHRCILAMIIQNRNKVNLSLVRSCIKRNARVYKRRWSPIAAAIAIGLVAVFIVVWLESQPLKKLVAYENELPGKTEKAAVLSGITAESATPDLSSLESSMEMENDASEEGAAVGPVGSISLPKVTKEEIVSLTEKSEKNTVEDVPAPESNIEKELPVTLGSVRLNRMETLSWMMVKVYGAYNKEKLALVRRANPYIRNPNDIEVGRAVLFPAVPLQPVRSLENVWWIKLAEKELLEEAFVFLRSYPATLPPARIIPYWDSNLGLKFALLLWGHYEDRNSAQKKLDSLRIPFSMQGEIISLQSENRIYFTDPFTGS